jgi:anti-sigma factor RsiW
VICADWHPDDDRLLSRYLDSGAPDDTLAAHLAWCRACARRATELARTLDDIHRAAVDEADAAFGADALASQRAAVQRRLGAEVTGRVLPFPVRTTSERHPLLIRVAAAAVLLALGGAGLVRFADLSSADAPRPAIATLRPVQPSPVVTRRAQTPPDESLFAEIELSLAAPRTAELRALDDLTPHVRDVVARR